MNHFVRHHLTSPVAIGSLNPFPCCLLFSLLLLSGCLTSAAIFKAQLFTSPSLVYFGPFDLCRFGYSFLFRYPEFSIFLLESHFSSSLHSKLGSTPGTMHHSHLLLQTLTKKERESGSEYQNEYLKSFSEYLARIRYLSSYDIGILVCTWILLYLSLPWTIYFRL